MDLKLTFTLNPMLVDAWHLAKKIVEIDVVQFIVEGIEDVVEMLDGELFFYLGREDYVFVLEVFVVAVHGCDVVFVLFFVVLEGKCGHENWYIVLVLLYFLGGQHRNKMLYYQHLNSLNDNAVFLRVLAVDKDGYLFVMSFVDKFLEQKLMDNFWVHVTTHCIYFQEVEELQQIIEIYQLECGTIYCYGFINYLALF